MNRREVLVTTAAVLGTGCLGGGAGNGSGSATTDGTDSTDTTETDTGETAETTESTGTTTAETTTTAPATTETTRPATTTPATSTPEPTTTVPRNGASGTTTGTATGTPGGTTQPTIGDAVTDWSFAVRDRGDKPGSDAEISVENGGSRVVVTGTITGKNGCRTAVLDSARIDDGRLRIVVATARATDAATMCTQALVGISYRATVTAESQPASIAVVHRDADGAETITTTEPGA